MAVAKEKLGTKRQCPNCGARFYDLGNDDPVTCISCEHTFIPEILLKPRRPIPVADKPAAEKPEAEAVKHRKRIRFPGAANWYSVNSMIAAEKPEAEAVKHRKRMRFPAAAS